MFFIRIFFSQNYTSTTAGMAVAERTLTPHFLYPINEQMATKIQQLSELELYTLQHHVDLRLRVVRRTATNTKQATKVIKPGTKVRCVGLKKGRGLSGAPTNIIGVFKRWKKQYAEVDVSIGSSEPRNIVTYNGFPSTVVIYNPPPVPAIIPPPPPGVQATPLTAIKPIPLLLFAGQQQTPQPPQASTIIIPPNPWEEYQSLITEEWLRRMDNNDRRNVFKLAPLPQKNIAEMNGKVVITQQSKEVDLETGQVLRSNVVSTTTIDMVDLTYQ